MNKASGFIKSREFPKYLGDY